MQTAAVRKIYAEVLANAEQTAAGRGAELFAPEKLPGVLKNIGFTDVPAEAALRVPIEQLGDADTLAGPDISVMTRVWGLSTLMPVPVTVERGDG